MKLALLGHDADALALARAAASSAEHELTWASDLGDAADFVRAFAPSAKVSDYWETLLATNVADAVIVGRGDEELRTEQLRKLAQAAMPMLVVQPALESGLVYYEIEMLREEAGGVIVPYVPARWHPAVPLLRGVVQADDRSPLGSLEQVLIERSLLGRSKRIVLDHFCRDVDLARAILGDLTKVSAMGPTGPESSYGSLGVQLSGPAGPLVRWSIAPPSDITGGRLTLVGTNGSLALDMSPTSYWSLEWRLDGKSRAESLGPWDAATTGLARLAEATTRHAPVPTWLEMARSIELTAAVDRSLTKGKTIELRFEGNNEKGAFEGLMASLGCGVLILCLVVIVAAATLQSLTGWKFLNFVPHVLLGLLAVFLLVQSLRLVLPRDADSETQGSE